MGFSFRRFLLILRHVGPLALMSAGVPAPLIPVIVSAISKAEDGHSTGAEKKTQVLNIVDAAVAGLNAMKPGTVVEGYHDVVKSGIDTTIAVVNLIQGQKTGRVKDEWR